MNRRYTDREIKNLCELHKSIKNPNPHWRKKPRECPTYEQRTYNVEGITEYGLKCRFLVYQRMSLRDVHNYSCGIIYLPQNGSRLTLARYNGANHKHKDIRYKPHIHRATEAAIVAGRKPESCATETDRYNSFEGAFLCLAEDFNISGLDQKHYMRNLFNEPSS